MRVAAVQFAPRFKEPARNLQLAGSLVTRAAQEGAQLVVLPELCTTGYSFQSVEEALPFGEVLDDTLKSGGPVSMNFFGDLANNLNIAIAWGLVEKDYGTGDLYNSQVLMQPGHGFIHYRKVNLWGNDFIWAKEGASSPPVTKYLDKKVGLLICRDVRDKAPAWKELYEPGDADIVCFSSNWGDGGFPSVNWVQFAKENQVFLVVANRYGKERNNNFGEGGVCVIEPCGRVRCEGLQWNQPCIVYAEV